MNRIRFRAVALLDLSVVVVDAVPVVVAVDADVLVTGAAVASIGSAGSICSPDSNCCVGACVALITDACGAATLVIGIC